MKTSQIQKRKKMKTNQIQILMKTFISMGHMQLHRPMDVHYTAFLRKVITLMSHLANQQPLFSISKNIHLVTLNHPLKLPNPKICYGSKELLMINRKLQVSMIKAKDLKSRRTQAVFISKILILYHLTKTQFCTSTMNICTDTTNTLI